MGRLGRSVSPRDRRLSVVCFCRVPYLQRGHGRELGGIRRSRGQNPDAPEVFFIWLAGKTGCLSFELWDWEVEVFGSIDLSDYLSIYISVDIDTYLLIYFVQNGYILPTGWAWIFNRDAFELPYLLLDIVLYIVFAQALPIYCLGITYTY